MKGIPIKFRGRCWLKGLDPSDIKTTLNDGDYVYGGYARMKFLFEDDEGDFIIDNNGTSFLVYHDTVAQLVGYDADRNEVYEGDKLYYYRCFGVSGDYIRQNKIPKAGVCTVIDAHYLDGLPYVGLNDSWEYAFLLKK